MMKKYLFIALLMVTVLLIFRVYVYHSNEISISRIDTTEPEISSSRLPMDISETRQERPPKVTTSELALNADVAVEDEYIQVPQPLSDESLLLVRQRKHESQLQDTIKYIIDPQSDTPVEIIVDSDSVEADDYIQIPQPLSDEPLYVTRQDTQYSQGDNEIQYLPGPLSRTLLEFELDTTEPSDYVVITQPLSDEPLYLARQDIENLEAKDDVRFIRQPLSDVPLKVEVDNASHEASFHIQIPDPLTTY